MSHTYRYQAGETEVTVLVNSDWSGYAEVIWKDADGHHGPLNIPGPVLQAIARQEGKALLNAAFERLVETL